MLQTNRLSKNSPLLIDVAEYDEIATIDSGSDCENETVKRSSSKNLNRTTAYLTPKARLAFIKLKKAFTKVLILQYFDPKCHI